MTRTALLAAAAFAMLATPVFAAERGRSEAASDTNATSAQAPTAATPKAERKTCRTFENTVSRLKAERLCLTRDEWKKFEEQQQ